MSIFEACARSGAIALDLLLAVLLLTKGRDIVAARWAGLFVAGTAAVLVVYAVPFVTDRSPWLIPLRILAFGNPVMFWVVTAALFDDEFTVSKVQAAAWLLLMGLGFWAVYGGPWSPTFRPANVASVICVAIALVQIGVGHAGDLIDARRRLRVIFVLTVAPFTIAIIVATTLLHGGRDFPALGLVRRLRPASQPMSYGSHLRVRDLVQTPSPSS
jgi:hypothetical protein